MVKKLNPIIVQRTLLERGFPIFTPREFQHIFEVLPDAAAKFIHQHIERSFFFRLRNGLYALETNRPPLFLVANKLYTPSYISLETALSRYGIIPEVVYSVTSVTPRPTQSFEVFGVDFTYTRIKQSAFQGVTTQKEADTTIHMAEPEKALVDYLYLVSLGKKSLNERIYCSRLDKKKALFYAELFGRTRLPQLIERVWSIPEPVLS